MSKSVKTHLHAFLLLWTLLAVAGCAIFPRPPAEPESPPAEIAEHIPSHRAFDHRPYELIWADRVEDHGPLIDFEGLLGWTVEADTPVRASFARSQEKQLWGSYVGTLRYQSTSLTHRVVVRPPAPIPIPEYFTAMDVWVYGSSNTVDHPVDIQVLVTDASGASFRIPLARVEGTGWVLRNRRLATEPDLLLRHPCVFEGLEFRNLYAAQPSELYIDSLAFYAETFHALSYPTRPRRPLDPGPGQSPGLHTGKGMLPFPVRPQSVMPESTPLSRPPALSRLERGGFRYSFRMDGADYAYEFDPDEGFSSLHVVRDGKRMAAPMHGARILLSSEKERRVVVLRHDRDELFIEYDDGLRCQLAMTGHVMRVDISLRGGQAEGLDLGGLRTTSPARRLSIPYLTADPSYSPSISVITPQDGAPVFVGVYPDWYRSNASEWMPGESATSVIPHGLARYRPVHLGRRNDLYERIYIVVAPILDDVLPMAPHSAGPYASEAASRVWLDAQGPESYAQEQERLLGLEALGLTNILYVAGPAVWSERDDSRSFRDRAAPRRGGDAALRAFTEALEQRGWRTGLHMNVLELSPINRYWSPDRIQRNPDGTWKDGPGLTYAARSVESLMLATNIARSLTEKFPVSAIYLDALGDLPPWRHTDYDNRVPGAGGYLTSYYLSGELMTGLSGVMNGPVVISDRLAWLYAGLADALVSTDVSRVGEPYLPLFKLTRLHQRSAFHGAPYHVESWNEKSVDRYLAAQIAYGNSGRIPVSPDDPAQSARMYHLMKALQQQYALQAPERISYWNGKGYVGTSDALVDGTWQRSQIYVLYPGNLEIWVNGSDGEMWDIRIGSELWRLPPSGWAAVAPEFFACSALVEGDRIDFVESVEYIYFDGRGSTRSWRGFSCAGPMVIRGAEILPIGGVETFSVGRSNHLAVEPTAGRAYSRSGELLGAIAIVPERDRWDITCPPGTTRILLE